MSSPFSMRKFFASRCMRALALFAWLLLVLSLPMASVGHAGGMERHDKSADMVSMAGHGMHHAMAMGGQHADDCCGGPSHPACHCEAMCGSAMLPEITASFGPALLADRYEPLRGVEAPTLDPIPPLRPPAV